MLRLASTTPEWITLIPATGTEPALRVLFAPIGIKDVRAARRAASEAFQVDREDVEQAGDEMSRVLIRRGILDWEGVGGSDGQPIRPDQLFPVLDAAAQPVLDEKGEPRMQTGAEIFAADPRAFEVADELYVIPWLDRYREGNGSSVSPGGTGQAETPAANTASTPAIGEITGDAAPTSSPAKEKRARTSRTPRGRKKG